MKMKLRHIPPVILYINSTISFSNPNCVLFHQIFCSQPRRFFISFCFLQLEFHFISFLFQPGLVFHQFSLFQPEFSFITFSALVWVLSRSITPWFYFISFSFSNLSFIRNQSTMNQMNNTPQQIPRTSLLKQCQAKMAKKGLLVETGFLDLFKQGIILEDRWEGIPKVLHSDVDRTTTYNPKYCTMLDLQSVGKIETGCPRAPMGNVWPFAIRCFLVKY